VYNLALRMLKNREEAEETAQDVFIKVYKSLDGFKGDSKFNTWLYRIAYNTCLDRIKKLHRERSSESINDYNPAHNQTADDSSDYIQREDSINKVKACLNSLPGEDHALVMMYYYEDKSLEEIAAIINLKPNHIKVKLFRLRKRLEVLLSQKTQEKFTV
jgi:RNA polymerase sigma-70 factor (ECF subfamily)